MTTLGVFRDDFYPISVALPPTQYTASTANLASTVLAASSIVGAQETYFKASGQTAAQGITTDSAVNIIAALTNSILQAVKSSTVPQVQGASWIFEFWNANTSSGAVTLTAGTGVTITGTNTLAVGVGRVYIVTITSPTTVTFQDIGGSALT